MGSWPILAEVAGFFSELLGKLSTRPLNPAAQPGPTQPRSLPGLSRPAGSWAALAAT
jgi:hypothetical protein